MSENTTPELTAAIAALLAAVDRPGQWPRPHRRQC